MTQDDRTNLTWFNQWSFLVCFYCSDSAWSSPFLVQFRMSQRQFHSLRCARGRLDPNRLIPIILLVSTCFDNIFLSMWRSSLLHLHDLIFKTSNVCVGFSWGLVQMQRLYSFICSAKAVFLHLKSWKHLETLSEQLWYFKTLCLVNLHHAHKRVDFVYQQTNHTLSAMVPLFAVTWRVQIHTSLLLQTIATPVISQSQSLHSLFHTSIFVQAETIWPERRHKKANSLQPRPTCVVSAMLIFNTKLLRFLWCMRMEEPGSNWSWSDKEHLHLLNSKYSAFFL